MCARCVQIPSSVFWKELALAMPRKVVFRSESAGDAQTMLQDDKDPMLTLNPDYLDCSSDTDPAGDLGKNQGYWTKQSSSTIVRWNLYMIIIMQKKTFA